MSSLQVPNTGLHVISPAGPLARNYLIGTATFGKPHSSCYDPNPNPDPLPEPEPQPPTPAAAPTPAPTPTLAPTRRALTPRRPARAASGGLAMGGVLRRGDRRGAARRQRARREG